MRRKKTSPAGWMGWLLLAAGLLLFLYPDLMEVRLSLHTIRELNRFEETYMPDTGAEITDNEADTAENTAEQQEGISENNPEKLQLWQALEVYNDEIYRNHQADFADPFSICQVPAALKGWTGGCFGYIEIPAMDVKLALYVGATEENMAKGAVILSQTSMPVGGVNTCSVIAAHRGYCGAAYFRDIEMVHPKDTVYIENPWGILCYTVKKTAIIDPCDSDRVKIQEGKDMLILLTCHPYRSHGKQRYLVYCERSEGADVRGNGGTIKTERSTEEEPEQTDASSVKDIRREKLIRMAVAVILVIMCAGLWRRRRQSERKKQRK